MDNWSIDFGWVKAHVGLYGNELADNLAKEAAHTSSRMVCYERIPKSAVINELREASLMEWQSEWEQTSNGMLTKLFFPSVKHRLSSRFTLSRNFTMVVTGHGRLGAYYHRFKIKDDPTCICNEGEQTVEHLLFECNMLNKERRIFKNSVLRSGGQWPPNKSEMTQKYVKQFPKYVNKINFDSL